MEHFIDFYRRGKRQGPGSDEYTLEALKLIHHLPNHPKILDIGCGCGASTLILAKNTNGAITALDYFEPFLDQLRESLLVDQLSKRVTVLQGDMNNLDFEPESFDLIWSEGAIYLMGFIKGIQQWKPLLKKEGYLVVSELVYTQHHLPQKLVSHWKETYAETDLVSKKIADIEDNGFRCLAHMVLSREAWEENFYQPLKQQRRAYLQHWNHHPQAQAVVDEFNQEVALYRQHANCCSYAFLSCKKYKTTMRLAKTGKKKPHHAFS